MKQVTGRTNPNTAIDKVSIRLALDGHSFSISGREEQGVASDVAVEVLTPRTLLVPVELLKRAMVAENEWADLLAMAGLTIKRGECVICSRECNEMAAVMAVPQDAVEQIRNQFKQEIRYTTPLLEISAEGTVMRLHQIASLLYIKVYSENRLQLAEVIPIAEEGDWCYFFEQIDAEFPLKNYRAIISGEDSKKLRRLFGKRFKEVICE